MNRGMISKRYAKALLQYALDQKAEDVVFDEMKTIASVFVREPRLRMAMDNPTVTKNDKLKLVEAAAGGKISEQLTRFVELVVQNRRETHLYVMALGYQDLYCKAKQINMGKLVTATPVDKAMVDKMKALISQVKAGSLVLETIVDPTIDGGFVLFVDTYRYDASVASQLKSIKRKFVAEATQIA